MIGKLTPWLFLFLLFSGLIPEQGIGDVYVWTDENGVRHYSNISPPDRKAVVQKQETVPRISKGERFKVIHIFDGDTLEVRGAGLTFKVRLVGIDSPETGRKGQKGQPYAEKAKQRLRDRVMGRQVRLRQYGTGGYNRILAEVFSEGQNINLHMVRTGMAEVYRGKPPSDLNIGAYTRAQNEAKSNRTGIWSLGNQYKSPRQWRKENPWN